MNRRGIAGALWLVAAGFAIAMTLIFRTDQVQWVVTMAIGVIAAVLGQWLIARSSALVVSASNLMAVVWTVLYAVLTVQQSGDLAAWTTAGQRARAVDRGTRRRSPAPRVAGGRVLTAARLVAEAGDVERFRSSAASRCSPGWRRSPPRRARSGGCASTGVATAG